MKSGYESNGNLLIISGEGGTRFLQISSLKIEKSGLVKLILMGKIKMLVCGMVSVRWEGGAGPKFLKTV